MWKPPHDLGRFLFSLIEAFAYFCDPVMKLTGETANSNKL
jgi:hypothetical protein